MHVAAHVAKERTSCWRYQLTLLRIRLAAGRALLIRSYAQQGLGNLNSSQSNAVTVSMARHWNDAALLVPAFMLTMR